MHLQSHRGSMCAFTDLYQRVHALMCLRKVSKWIHLNPPSTHKLLICPIYYRLFHSMERGSRIHMPLDWNHCRWENGANTLRGAAILKVSESLISSRKSSRQIYGKWESRDSKWLSSAGYSVITVFCLRRATSVQLFSSLWLTEVWSLIEGVCSCSLCRWKWKVPSSEMNFLRKTLKRIVILQNIIRRAQKSQKSWSNTNLIASSLPKGSSMEMRHFVWLKIFSF